MVRYLKRNFPKLIVYHDSVTNVCKYLYLNSTEYADIIVSSLPWSCFENELQDISLNETLKALRKGGKFVTYIYLNSLLMPSGKQFQKKLLCNFSTINRSPIIWQNIPPAFIYECIK